MTGTTLPRLVLGDFLQRFRSPDFLVSLAVIGWLVHGMMPPESAGYRTFELGDGFRPTYGAAWVGALVALLTGTYFLFVGFYLVKGSVDRDRRTGVGEILASTRIGAVRYLLAKTFSNWLVFVAMTLVAIVVAGVMQQLLGEDRRVDVVALVLPFALITLPIAAVVAAAAVWFECVPPLRGGFGNLAWFFVLGLVLSGMEGEFDYRRSARFSDLAGVNMVTHSAARAAQRAYPRFKIDGRSVNIGVNVSPEMKGQPVRRYPWEGLRWTPETVARRLQWFGVALGLVFAASLTFDRFDTARGWKLPSRRRRRVAPEVEDLANAGPAPRADLVHYAGALTPARRGASFAQLWLAELKLLLRSQPWWWYVGAFGLALGMLLSPLQHGRAAWLPVASFWPVFAWSALGGREQRWGVAPCVFSAPRPLRRLLVASWLAGASVALALGAPFVLRLALAQDAHSIVGLVVGAAFAPALALALGVWTGGGKFFEVLYLFLWYTGPLHAVAVLDYTGVTTPRPVAVTAAYALLTAGLVGLALLGRARQIRG